ncbi:hypothetical protein AX17_003866 [Amanita inopinata Kibby_2008]|nr:hypothetical protein AX17_003866 [Amanita inopinata Kibby_2008]
MAWSDVFALGFIIAIFAGIFYGVLYVTRGLSETMQTTKESLKSRGYDVSSTGVSVKTSKHFDREHYVDATQRGMVRAWGASSFGPPGVNGDNEPSKLKGHHWQRRSSSGSISGLPAAYEESSGTKENALKRSISNDNEEKKQKSRFWKGKHSARLTK